jgi:acetylglutamate kinase
VTTVLKLGGGAFDQVPFLAARAEDEPRLCLVHGARPHIDRRMRAGGLRPRFEAGRRITDAATLACVVAGFEDAAVELSGLLRAAGLRPVSLSGGVFEADRSPVLGLVGVSASAQTGAVEQVWSSGGLPLVTPVARERDGGAVLNLNADDAAACLAAALGADELCFVSDVAGVLDPAGAPMATVAASAPPESVAGGMLAKLEAAGAALAGGVGDVRIGHATSVRA